MGSIAKYRKRKVAMLTAAVVASAWMPSVEALPSGAHNEQGVESIKTSGGTWLGWGILGKKDDTMTVTLNAKKAAIDWNSFNIGKGETVNFKALDNIKNWMILNRVDPSGLSGLFGGGSSTIDGVLNGQGGTVFIVNPDGVLFGANARVDVGSLVASTMDITQDNFMKKDVFVFDKTGTNAITISKGADITARDGYVAIFAHEINNEGTITAPEVAMAGGKSIELSYDNKINLVVNVSDDKLATVDTKNNYVLMTAENASNIIGDSIINNSGTINAAKGITKDEAGNLILSGDGGKIDMVAARVLVNGELNADGDKGGTITTSGYEVMQVNDGSKVHAASKDGEAGTWNVIGKNATIDSGVTGTDLSNDNNGVTKGVNKISNTVVSNSLVNTNVSVEASPDKETYYSDVRVNKAVEKTSGDKTTTLTLTAGRNVIVEDDIKSSAGALNVKLNSDVRKLTEEDKAKGETREGITNSMREDGANIVKADIETNGGDFTTTGELGTYFGMKEVAQAGPKAKRYVKTNGGNISLGGKEVLLATGGTVELDTTTAEGKNGTVTIEGSVNSANAYQSKHEKNQLTWGEATTNAKKVSDKSHLAVITGALEDAVATSTINTDFSDTAEAFIGGHVVAVAMKKDTDGNYYPVDANGNFITMTNGVLSADPVLKDGKVTTLDGTSENVPGNTSGWYNLKNGGHARFWGWTEGEEKGTIFYVQTVGEVIDHHDGNNDTAWQSKSHGYALKDKFDRKYYTNFAPGEPNDDMGQTGQTALAVNYDTYKSNQRKDLLYSQWDDINDYKSGTHITYYVVETDLGHTSLNIKADETLIKGSVGNTNKLNNLDIDSTGSVTVNGSIQVDNHVDAKAQTDATFNKFIDAEKDYVKLEAINGNVTADGAVKAGTDITMAAGNNVTAGDIVKAGRDVTMDAKGNVLAKGDVTAVRNVDMKAVGNVTAEKNITAGNYVHVAASHDATTQGKVWAKGSDINMAATNGSLTTEGAVEAHDDVTMTAGKDITVKAAVKTGGNMSAHAGNNMTTAKAGTIDASNGSISLIADNKDLTVSGAVTIGQDFTATAGNNATINVAVNAANGEVDMKAGETLKTTDVTAGKNVKAEGNNINTTGKVEAKGGAVTMTATNELKAVDVTAATDVIGSGKDINITGAVNATQGEAKLTAGSALIANDVTAGTSVTAEGANVTTTGKVEAKGGAVTMTATSGSVTAEKAVSASESVGVKAGTDITTNGLVKAEAGAVTMEADKGNVTSQNVEANGGVAKLQSENGNVKANDVYAANEVNLKAKDSVEANAVTAGTSVTAEGADVTTNGKVEARMGEANLKAGNNLVANDVQAGTDAVLEAGNQVKANALTAGKDVSAIGGDVNLTGDVNANGESVLLVAHDKDVKAEGKITAAKSVTIYSDKKDIETKAIEAGQDVLAHAFNSVTTEGLVKTEKGAITMVADNGNVTSEDVTAGGDIAQLIAIKGDVKADNVKSVTGEVLLKSEQSNVTADSVEAESKVTVMAGKDATTNGDVTAKTGEVYMEAGHDINAKGAVNADNNNVTMRAGYDISTADVTANQKVRMDAGNDVTINGYIAGLAENVEDAVDIRAQKRFLNKLAEAGQVSLQRFLLRAATATGKDSSKAIQVGEGSHWKVYSDNPYEDDFGGGVNETGFSSSNKDLNSGNYAVWGWDGTSTTSEVGNRYIFKNPRPTLTIKANDARKEVSEDWRGKNTGYTMSNSLSGQFKSAFLDGDDEKLVSRVGYTLIGTYSNGFKPNVYKEGIYEGDITLTNTGDAAPAGFNLVLLPGTLTVYKNQTPNDDNKRKVTPEGPGANDSVNPGEKPQIDPLGTSNLNGSASYTTNMAQAPSADRVLGLQSAELPFFNKKHGVVKFYGTYDVTVDPDKVKMEPTAKVLPEPEQEPTKAQYREYDKELTTAAGTAKFRLTYNGTTLDIYPTDAASMAILTAGDGTKNVEVESQALFAAFKEMGITLDDLDGVYTHFEELKDYSFRS